MPLAAAVGGATIEGLILLFNAGTSLVGGWAIIAGLSFEIAAWLEYAKIGIIVGSILSGLLVFVLFKKCLFNL